MNFYLNLLIINKLIQKSKEEIYKITNWKETRFNLLFLQTNFIFNLIFVLLIFCFHFLSHQLQNHQTKIKQIFKMIPNIWYGI